MHCIEQHYGSPSVIPGRCGYALDPATGLRPGGKAVLLTVSNRGFERAVGVITAQDGSFVHVSTPSAGEAGIYYVTASYPYAVSRLAQSSYSITGFEPGYTDYSARLAQNSSYTFDVPLHNTGETVLTGLEVSFTQDSGTGVAVSAAAPPADIQPGERKNLSVTLNAAPDASSAASFTLKVRESRGFERVMPVNVAVSPAEVVPRLTPQSFEMGLLAGEVRSRAVTVENIGYSAWTGITAGAPSLAWVRLQGPPQLGDLPPGGNVTFTLLVEPPPGLSNGVYPLSLQLAGAGRPAVPVSAAITVTSDRQGGLLFTALNADKTPGDPGRWIGGADFTLTSVDIKGLSLRARTDPNGLARFENVPAGRYGWRAEAEGFQTVTGQADVEPGLTPALTALLPTAMVTYKWSVTPTTIQDKYDITLDMTFRTDVPAPALVLDPPSLSLNMKGGETAYAQFTLTNRG
ncbi:MAG TPA: carboxypeptidase-like regulatory domain-containing protein, partial [Elusimicrobiales bacterium]|nr:carboxypeptidase-like regulatory domain-containing protein [Elusimicrobiales bacterium]